MRPSGKPTDKNAMQLIDARLYASIVESSHDAIISKSLEGIILSWNAAAERLFGYSAEQALGRHISLLIPADRTEEEEGILTRLRAGERIEHYDTVRVRSDGKHIQVSSCVSPVTDAGGQIVMASKIVRDITERREAEEARRRSELNLADFFENANLGMHWVGPDGIILRANRAEMELLGYSAEEYVGSHISKFHADESVIQTILSSLSRGDTLDDYPARLRSKDGSIREVLINSSVFREDGEFIHTRCVTRDVTAQKRAEADIWEKEQLFRATFDSAPVGIAHVGLDGRWLRFNDAVCAITGYAREKLTALTFADITHPEDLEADWEQAHRLSAGEIALYTMEKRYVREQGDFVWVRLTVSLLRNAAGAPVNFISVIEDFTERKKAEDALGESQLFTRRVLDNLFAFVGLMTADGTLIDVNRAPLEAASISASDVIGKKFWDCYWWSYSPLVQERLRVACERAAAGETIRYDVPVRMAGDMEMWIDFQLAPLRDSNANITHLVASGMDISERRLTSAALRESEERFRDLAENIPQLAWVAEPGSEGKISWFNKTWLDFTGSSIEQMSGSGWKSVHHPDYVERVVQKFEYHVKNSLDWEDTFPLRGKDGQYRWFLSRMKCIRDQSGQVVRIFGTNTDITRERQLEEQLRQLAAELSEANLRKDEFLATLAHELRNPLAPIRNGLQLMKLAGGQQQASIEQARSMMERQLTQMVRLVDDLMDVSRISLGKLELRKEQLPLARVLSSAVETSRPLIEQMGQELDFTPPDPSVIVYGDLTRLAQVFLNLLNNAAKYSNQGGRIQVNIELLGSEVVVAVKDTGIGIAADQLPRIFGMFTQLDGSLEKSQGGLGIGLTLVKRLVEMHGGMIEAHSEGPGKGSEFIVRLPLVLKANQVQSLGVENEQAASKSSLRILIVDDNRDGADSLAEMLALLGNDTCAAYDGQQGVDRAEEYRPDVIVFDIGMPKLNGYEACRVIRNRPWGKKVVLIAVTGWGQEKDRKRTREAGFDHHLVKPVDPQDLMKILAGLQDGQEIA